MFLEFWRRGLLAYDDAFGIEWERLAMDGALGMAPFGGELTGPNPTDRAKKRSGASSARVRVSRSGSRLPARNLNDFKLARTTIASIPVERPEPSPERPQGLCLDKAMTTSVRLRPTRSYTTLWDVTAA